MILYNGPNTPFGRMALVFALELGLGVENRVIRVGEAEFLDDLNPLRQIPTLLLGDGRAVFDSRVICRYFGSLVPGNALLPDDLDVETRWALAVGLMDVAVALRMEQIRPEGEKSSSAMAANARRMAKAVARLEADLPAFRDALRIDRIALAVALDYINFRHGTVWAAEAPGLADWLDGERARETMQATVPTA